MTNPLVAKAPEEGSGFTKGTGDNGWATGVSIAESAMDTFNGFKDGNWIEGGLGVVGLAADAASMAIDPFGTLMSSAASFLMEHVQPLKDMLDWLAGDPPVIESYSTTWNNVSTEMGKISQDYAAALSSGTEGWTGAAADAYRAAATQQGDALAGAASAAGSVGTVVGIMGMVVAFVREMVRDLIADLVAKLITWVLEAVFSLGFGTPVIVAQAITAISKWAARIAKLVQKLLDTIKKVSPMLKRLVEIFEKIMKVLGKIAGKVTGLDVFGTKFDDPGFLKKLGRDGVDTPSGSPTGSSPSGRSNPDGPDTSPDTSPDGTSPSTGTPDSTPTSAGPTSTSPNGGQPPARDTTGPGDTTPSQTTSSTPSSTTPSAHTPHSPAGNSPTSSAHSPDSTPSGPSSPSPHSPGTAPSPAPTPGHSPSSTPSGHSPSSSPSSSPTTHSPNSPGSTPSSHSPAPAPAAHSPNGNPSPSGHSPTSPSSSPPRVDQTHSSATAAPDAPHRTDQPHTAAPRDPSPSSVPQQPSPGGAPHAGGQPGGAPSAGGPPPRTGGGGWTGTSGHRGDTTSGVPQSRPHETPGGTSRPQGAPPPHAAGPSSPRPNAGPPPFRPQTGPPHAGPPQTRSSQAGPPHQGPPRQGPPHQNAPHQPQPRGPQSGPPHDRGGVPPQRDPNGAPHHDNPNPDGTHPPHTPEPRPNIDEAHARHGETTPAGVSHHRGDPDMGDLPSRVPNDPRYFTADVHITPDGRARIGNHTYSPEEYGDLLRRSGWDGKTPIRLIGCDAGSNDFAKRLSAHTDAPVLAPTKPAWTDSKGRVFTSDAEVDVNGNRQPKIPPNGEWETHSPDGTRTKAGEDGFVPGTHDKDKTDLDPTDAKDRAADSDGPGERPDEEHSQRVPSATERRENSTDFPDPVDPGPAPDTRSPDFEQDRTRGSVLEQVDINDTDRVTMKDGLIETIDGKPVKDYVGDLAKARAEQLGGLNGRANGPYGAVAIDRRTGLVTEGVNGRAATDVIPNENLHPLLRENIRDMDEWQHPVMKNEAELVQTPVLDENHKAVKDENGNVVLGDWVLQGRVHADVPLKHAEVKAANELLWARQRQHEIDWKAQHGPDSQPPPLGREALGDVRVDPRNLQDQFRKAEGGKVQVGSIGDPGPACGNCNVILRDVGSYTGRLQFAPHDYRSRDSLIPPVTE